MAKYMITYIVNRDDNDYGVCYADSKKRAVRIAERMFGAEYHFVKVERIKEIKLTSRR